MSDASKMYIRGEWVNAENGETFDVPDPDTRHRLCVCSRRKRVTPNA